MGDFIWYALIGLATGLLARAVNRGGRLGVIGDGGVGMLGAVLAVLLYRFALDDPGGMLSLAAVAAAGAALLVLDLRLIQKALEERRVPLAFLRRCSPLLKRAPLTPRPLNDCAGICRVCGQKHLS
ncbi:MAG TPA: hypothetical protein VN419_08420 [Humidesulfovibrio sp.]|uniref:hypothetical protein n=1 Tax=Humidesulfovibrio sp. TaxID=2910988 RepID=UPI002C42F75F|nr:hypothetical protein [Humidesulfovibrio sp.]HWR04033.1 hypothetical protein [Humidesulfovibrio sp.]